jgi:hypothetical protein
MDLRAAIERRRPQLTPLSDLALGSSNKGGLWSRPSIDLLNISLRDNYAKENNHIK